MFHNVIVRLVEITYRPYSLSSLAASSFLESSEIPDDASPAIAEFGLLSGLSSFAPISLSAVRYTQMCQEIRCPVRPYGCPMSAARHTV